MHRLLILILSVLPLTAHAQSDASLEKLCAHVTDGKQEVEPNDAEYVPGIDVNGNPVVPAELSDSDIKNDIIILPIDMDIAERYGLILPEGIELKPNIANMTLHQNGRVYFENEDISEAIRSLCLSYKKNQSNQEEEHGHESANPVLSSDKIEEQYSEQ